MRNKSCGCPEALMFDVTADEIASLKDVELRELVNRLCEVELAGRGLSTVAVQWGGNQTAAGVSGRWIQVLPRPVWCGAVQAA